MNWFKTGLKFSCQSCGKCCQGPGGYVWLNEQEISCFSEKIGISEKEFLKKYVRNAYGRYALIDNNLGACIFMNEDGTCKYYNERPSQCKTFPWWPEIIENKEEWESNPYNCPGIGIGRLYTEEEIEEALKDQ